MFIEHRIDMFLNLKLVKLVSGTYARRAMFYLSATAFLVINYKLLITSTLTLRYLLLLILKI